MTTTIHGHCDPRFEPVREAFAANFAEGSELGACTALSLEGEIVVDLWAGARDRAGTLPWEQDTIVNVWSSTKTMAALCLLVLADRGVVDLHGPVASYWPEFAQNGKAGIEVRHFLSHSAGLSGLAEPLGATDLYDWDKVIGVLERQAPWWEPGTASGYHSVTQGYLIGEVVRRVTGRSLGQFFAAEIAGPLDADFHIGIGREHFPRIAELVPPTGGELTAGEPGSIMARTFANPQIDAAVANTDGWRLAEVPAGNGHGNARGIVRAQTPLANGGRAFGVELLSAAGARRIFEQQTSGEDLVLGVPLRFGMGYGLSSEVLPLGPNPHTAYWGGWGGSTVVVDQDARLCMAYVMNRMADDLLGDLRGFSILEAAYAAMG